MTTPSKLVQQQLDVDKAATLMNNSLDDIDAKIMSQGRDYNEMNYVGPKGYRDILTKYSMMLSALSAKKDLTQKQLVAYINDLELFSPFNKIISGMNPDVYPKALAKVKETLTTRIDYFFALNCALSNDRYSSPVDVAWFHRTHRDHVVNYLKQHPANKVLTLDEDSKVKAECDFKAFKMELVNSLNTIINQLTSHSNKFFKISAVKSDIANYYAHYLLEPLKAIANDIGIRNYSSFKEAILNLHKSFNEQLKALKLSDPRPLIKLSEELQEYFVNKLKTLHSDDAVPVGLLTDELKKYFARTLLADKHYNSDLMTLLSKAIQKFLNDELNKCNLHDSKSLSKLLKDLFARLDDQLQQISEPDPSIKLSDEAIQFLKIHATKVVNPLITHALHDIQAKLSGAGTKTEKTESKESSAKYIIESEEFTDEELAAEFTFGL
jgi:hypothetical protein